MNKASLRKEFLYKRMSLAENEVEEMNLLISSNTINYLQKRFFKTIHTFLPQRGKNEIDTWRIIASLQNAFPEVRITVPYVIPGTKQMDHYILNTETHLLENRWGIPEPDPTTSVKVDPKSVVVVLIPLLAFDKAGFRVGYGGGFYDRFLVQCENNVLKVGLSFFEAVAKIEDVDRFDVKMDACVTPAGIWRF